MDATREALEILKHKNLELDIVHYLQDTLNVGQLIQIISLLGIEPRVKVKIFFLLFGILETNKLVKSKCL